MVLTGGHPIPSRTLGLSNQRVSHPTGKTRVHRGRPFATNAIPRMLKASAAATSVQIPLGTPPLSCPFPIPIGIGRPLLPAACCIPLGSRRSALCSPSPVSLLQATRCQLLAVSVSPSLRFLASPPPSVLAFKAFRLPAAVALPPQRSGRVPHYEGRQNRQRIIRAQPGGHGAEQPIQRGRGTVRRSATL
jgi:hypothetical protein